MVVLQHLIDKVDAFFLRVKTTPVPIVSVEARAIAEAWAVVCALAPAHALPLYEDPILRIAATNLHGIVEALRVIIDELGSTQRPDLRIGVTAWTAVLIDDLVSNQESDHVARLALVQFARTAAPRQTRLSQRDHRWFRRQLGLPVPRLVPQGFRILADRYMRRCLCEKTKKLTTVDNTEIELLRREDKHIGAKDIAAKASACDESKVKAVPTPNRMSLPDIVDALSSTVIGQEAAIRTFACCCWRHQQGIPQSAVLLSGPTGCGKSLLARRWAELAGRPVVSLDCASLVPEGIRGPSIGDGMLAAWRAAGRDVERAGTSVLVFEEFDKLFSSQYGTQVSHSMLTLLDGVPWSAFDTEKVDRGHQLTAIPTRGLLIILTGSFTDLRDQESVRVGFGASSRRSDQVEIDLDGLVPLADLRGRLGSHVQIAPLDQVALTNILLSDGGPLKSLRQLFPGFEVRPSAALINQIVSSALASHLGARAMWTIVRNLEVSLLFDPPDQPGERYGVQFSWRLRMLSDRLPPSVREVIAAHKEDSEMRAHST